MTSSIPQEIVDEIIGYVDEDIPTLTACSTVCGSFSASSRKYLFRHIVLDLSPERSANNLRLLHVLLSNPIIASFISSLHIDISLESKEEVVCGILPMLRNVQEVKISRASSAIRAGFIDWIDLYPRMGRCILDLLQRPSFHTLILGTVLFPEGQLRRLRYLRHLKVPFAHSLLMNDQFSHDSGQPNHQGHLESLTLGSWIAAQCVRFALHDPVHPSSLSLSRLRLCKIKSMTQASDGLQKIFDLATTHLQEVEMGIDLGNSNVYLDFSQLTALRVLRIHIRRGAMTMPGTWIMRVLATLPGSIVELTLRMVLNVALAISRTEWREIDALLSNHQTQTLRHIILQLDEWPVERSRPFFEDYTPELMKKGAIVIDSRAPKLAMSHWIDQ
ncbi:hypothetical protein FPV67DRAFT_1527220 [Lyophyllum atratum]|nr:hypothetical protein FPV67DRAFT_1527220 [Lyophyllum atratum]